MQLEKIKNIIADNFLVVDGAMATELEKKGVDTNNDLWSATALISDPTAVKEVHQSYFEAGANIAITDSYQANLGAFEEAGYSPTISRQLITKSVEVASQARTEFQNSFPKEQRVLLIAGSVGPYGAYLADGSEYTGAYHLTKQEFKDFHRSRMKLLAQGGVDIFAFETQPNFAETQALGELLYDEFPEMGAWLSFSVDGHDKLCDGTPLAKAANYFADDDQIFALGVNCTALTNILGLVKLLKANSPKPVLVYPNNGDTYDPVTKKWRKNFHAPSFADLAPQWKQAGATLIGGCCRTTPADIQQIAKNCR